MKTIHIYPNQIEQFNEPIAICLGYFDGVHLGHKDIIKKAKESKLPVGVITFDKPISTLINNGKSCEILTSLNDRFRILSRMDISYYFVIHIDLEFLNESPIQFVNLLTKLCVKEVYIGEDFRFGKNASGDPLFLSNYFKVNIVPLKSFDGTKISTQYIVKCLKDGDVKTANELMGQNYLITGMVVKGHQNGTKLGIKTANVKMDFNYVIPKFGVYKVIAYIDSIPHLALANFGVHPTIDQEVEPVLEIHIPHIDNDLYDHLISVEFLDFIRPEIKFESEQKLIEQINKDFTLLNK